MEPVQTGQEPKLPGRTRRLVAWPAPPPPLPNVVNLALAQTSVLADLLDKYSAVLEFLESELADLTSKERRAEEAYDRKVDDAILLGADGTADQKKAAARKAARAERDAWMDIQDEVEAVNRRLKGLSGRHSAVSRIISARQSG